MDGLVIILLQFKKHSVYSRLRLCKCGCLCKLLVLCKMDAAAGGCAAWGKWTGKRAFLHARPLNASIYRAGSRFSPFRNSLACLPFHRALSLPASNCTHELAHSYKPFLLRELLIFKKTFSFLLFTNERTTSVRWCTHVFKIYWELECVISLSLVRRCVRKTNFSRTSKVMSQHAEEKQPKPFSTASSEGKKQSLILLHKKWKCNQKTFPNRSRFPIKHTAPPRKNSPKQGKKNWI